MIRNPDFNGTPLFNVWYQKRHKIEIQLQWKTRTHMQSVELCHFQWLWVTP